VFNQIKAVSIVTLCTHTGAKSSVSLYTAEQKYGKTKLRCTSCQGKNLFSIVTHLEFAFSSNIFRISGHSGGSVFARRRGTPWKKSLSTALKMAKWHSVCEREATRMGSH